MSPPSRPFSHTQDEVLIVLERAIASLSILGSLFICVTIVAFPRLRKPINRLIGYASLGNIFASVACIIALSGVRDMNNMALCTVQAFLIQVFMAADSYWTFAMALNVYLTFFKGFNGYELRRMERWYFLACYGTPMIPALVYLFIDASHREPKIYGDATIWCWVSSSYDWARVAFFYGPAWLAVGSTTIIYAVVGRRIFKRRGELRAMSSRDHDRRENAYRRRTYPLSNMSSPIDITVKATTTIRIENTAAGTMDVPMNTTSIEHDPEQAADDVFARISNGSQTDSIHGLVAPSQKRVDDSMRGLQSKQATKRMNLLGADRQHTNNDMNSQFSPHEDNNSTTLSKMDSETNLQRPSRQVLTLEIPESPHDLASFEHKQFDRDSEETPSSGDFRGGILGTKAFDGIGVPPSPMDTLPTPTSYTRPVTNSDSRRTGNSLYHSAAMSYAKVALLFFIAQLSVWIPSTVNRVYSYALPKNPPNYALNLVAAAVLSTQGIWNFVIFTTTSWREIKKVFKEDLPSVN